jgi:hypothetical protein
MINRITIKQEYVTNSDKVVFGHVGIIFIELQDMQRVGAWE